MTRAALIATTALALEWARALGLRHWSTAVPVLLVGGLALCLPALWFSPAQLGLGLSGGGRRLLGGLALAAVLLLPAAVRWHGGPDLAAGAAAAALAVSVGEEVAFRGALYAALEAAAGAPAAIAGSTLVFTAGHLLSHPPAFLVAVLAAGLLLALWRWACHDLVAPIAGHCLADLAL